MKKYIKENKKFILSILLIIIIFNIKLPYYINKEGGIININNRIKYENKINYNGSLNMLYVTQYQATPPTYILSHIIKDWDREEIKKSAISNETPEEIEYRNKIMLENSINAAKYIAYKEAGKEIQVETKKTIVIGTSIENGLKIGDEIIEINNIQVEDIQTIKQEIQKYEAGEELKLKVIRKGKEKTINVEIKEIDKNKVIGVVIVTNYQYKAEPEIELTFKKSESGSSGGLMMALSIYCALSEEDLIKGRNIAGTGTIDTEGNVGEIAGIKYKIMGANKNKIDTVLVPSANYKEAIKVAKERNYKMKIIKVNTLKEAIEYLKNTSNV